jgi:hypothetical protein
MTQRYGQAFPARDGRKIVRKIVEIRAAHDTPSAWQAA